MRKLFTESVMDINVFDTEDVITTSGTQGTSADPASIDSTTYKTATADWNTASETLEFTF